MTYLSTRVLPRQWIEISINEIEALPMDLIKKLYDKLSNKTKGEWKRFSMKLKKQKMAYESGNGKMNRGKFIFLQSRGSVLFQNVIVFQSLIDELG